MLRPIVCRGSPYRRQGDSETLQSNEFICGSFHGLVARCLAMTVTPRGGSAVKKPPRRALGGVHIRSQMQKCLLDHLLGLFLGILRRLIVNKAANSAIRGRIRCCDSGVALSQVRYRSAASGCWRGRPAEAGAQAAGAAFEARAAYGVIALPCESAESGASVIFRKSLITIKNDGSQTRLKGPATSRFARSVLASDETVPAIRIQAP